jgi:nucleoside-diphosphate-sugar epimerase
MSLFLGLILLLFKVSSSSSTSSVWHDRHAPIDPSNARGIAESELLSLSSSSTPTSVLNLSGLWGGARDPKHWVLRVAPTKDKLAAKGSLHMIHGMDVARAVLAVHARVAAAAGQRWLLTDGRVYDWWDLASAWGPGAAAAGGEDGGSEENARNPHARWVRELMHEHGVRALARPAEQLGRALDSREFWDVFEVEPVMARL